ncbi:MAG: NAD(+)/NADH kinase, partial [Kiritimatiellae bacterium]|nr:NAD(+)/NADH kinase [Kiritimatiellia bacterium]
ERTMLEVGGVTALNDVVVLREMTGHAAVVDVSANGRSAMRFMADGVAIATPTGSTAYSLAAGGPVLMPDTRSFIITPINPHALGVRPMVVNDSVALTVTSRRSVNGACERLGVYADGESAGELSRGESVAVAKSPRAAKLVELEGYDPYEVLNRKLGWSK